MTRLRLDRDACQGHGRCYGSYPELFEPDEEGYGLVSSSEITEAQITSARAAVGSCPERAIHIEP